MPIHNDEAPLKLTIAQPMETVNSRDASGRLGLLTWSIAMSYSWAKFSKTDWRPRKVSECQIALRETRRTHLVQPHYVDVHEERRQDGDCSPQPEAGTEELVCILDCDETNAQNGNGSPEDGVRPREPPERIPETVWAFRSRLRSCRLLSSKMHGMWTITSHR